jgi:ABC-type transporter Mla MlaB component
MESNIRICDSAGSIEMQGDLTVSSAEQMRNVLLQGLQSSDTIVISFGEITDIDLTCLQLLCAAHRMSVKLGKKIVFGNDLPDKLSLAVTDYGFRRHVGCAIDTTKSCIWQGQAALKR